MESLFRGDSAGTTFEPQHEDIFVDKPGCPLDQRGSFSVIPDPLSGVLIVDIVVSF